MFILQAVATFLNQEHGTTFDVSEETIRQLPEQFIYINMETGHYKIVVIFRAIDDKQKLVVEGWFQTNDGQPCVIADVYMNRLIPYLQANLTVCTPGTVTDEAPFSVDHDQPTQQLLLSCTLTVAQNNTTNEAESDWMKVYRQAFLDIKKAAPIIERLHAGDLNGANAVAMQTFTQEKTWH